MCGIFGIAVGSNCPFSTKTIDKAFTQLGLLSQRRGKESAGTAFLNNQEIIVYKQPISAQELFKEKSFIKMKEDFFKKTFSIDKRYKDPFILMGHARLMTNGRQGINENNQPVITGKIVGIHNGIIVNTADIEKNLLGKRLNSSLDTDVLCCLIEYFRENSNDIIFSLRQTFQYIEGSAAIALMFQDINSFVLASNIGSLYYIYDKKKEFLIFASEKTFLENHLLTSFGLRANNLLESKISQISPLKMAILDINSFALTEYDLTKSSKKQELTYENINEKKSDRIIIDPIKIAQLKIKSLRRCTKCVLPETMPLINFDAKGVCNMCRSYQPMKRLGREALEILIAPFRNSNGKPNCVVALSGGRDSCYALHYIKKELGLNPIAYTYDWALVTDLARRNQAKLCGKLGVEHIIISANIKQKRKNIRNNIKAWLKRPDLGMIPLFMAGDKFYFYYLNKVRKEFNLDLAFIGGNSLEKTNFKTGFCNVSADESWRLYNVSWFKKIKLVMYYLNNFLMNPAYLNSSLADTIRAFFVSYMQKHHFTWLYDYIPWDESEIMRVLTKEYNWESATDTDATWRIGDGTAAFYNYIYYTVAGFSEHDTFRSNQIRENMITREQALQFLESDNAPRYSSIEEYANVIGFDFDEALSIIDRIPKVPLLRV